MAWVTGPRRRASVRTSRAPSRLMITSRPRWGCAPLTPATSTKQSPASGTPCMATCPPWHSTAAETPRGPCVTAGGPAGFSPAALAAASSRPASPWGSVRRFAGIPPRSAKTCSKVTPLRLRYPLEHRHREERPEVVVGDAQPGGQEPHHRPQHLIGDVAVEIEEQLEVGAGDRDQRAGRIGDRVGRALGTVEDRHLAEAGARLEDGQRFLPGPGDGPGDANLARGNNEEPVARLAFLEDVLADGELLLPADFGHAGQLALVEILEDRRLLQQIEGQVKPWVTRADLLTALRLPLAAAFPFVHQPAWQLALVGAAAASDFFDGMLARRFGASRAGAVLDPTADKVFMAAAFLTVARTGLLHPLEIVGVVARDIVAALGYVGAWLWRRPTALPARAGGKAVTVLQLLTLVAFIARSPLVRPLAWATAAVGLYAIWDYGRAAARARAMLTRGKGT